MRRMDSSSELWLARLREHVRELRYGEGVSNNYPYAARRFLRSLARRGRCVESVSPADFEHYLDSLRLRGYRRPSPDHSRRMHRAAVRMPLRLVHGEWSSEMPPSTAHEQAASAVVAAFDRWPP